jgi:hypothetical protein
LHQSCAVRFSLVKTGFSFSKIFTPIIYVQGIYTGMAKHPDCETDHISRPASQVMNAWNYVSNLLHTFKAWCLIQRRDKLTATFTKLRSTETKSCSLSKRSSVYSPMCNQGVEGFLNRPRSSNQSQDNSTLDIPYHSRATNCYWPCLLSEVRLTHTKPQEPA